MDEDADSSSDSVLMLILEEERDFARDVAGDCGRRGG